nr:MAG TPA: Serine/threonine-protein phosphatase 2A 65 kDa, shugoshin, Nucleus, Phosphoprotein, Hydrolase.7A [Caudoviricetes sp.]
MKLLTIPQPMMGRDQQMVQVILQLEMSRDRKAVQVILQLEKSRDQQMAQVILQLKKSRYLMMVQVILQPKKRLLKVKVSRNQNSLILPTLARTQKKSSPERRGIS